MNYDVLGNLPFDYGWVKSIDFHFFKQEITIPCVFSASKNEVISDEQKHAYTLFQQKQTYFEDRVRILLNHYFVENHIDLPDLSPRKFLFQRDGSFGLLLDCNWDEEHGIAVVLNPFEEVGMQDIFL